MERAKARAIARPLAALLALALIAAALEARLPGMTRPVWQDEVHHNEPILDSATMSELDRNDMFRSMMQPKLDFWMRKVFWFPVFGISERTIRLPALVFGVALVLLVYAVLLTFLRSRIELPWSVIVAFSASLWIVNNPMEVYYAVEGRHYSMVAFASTAWFAVVLLFDGKPRWLLSATALLFANTHFFSLPLIAAGYGLQIFRELRDRKYLWIILHVATCICIYECLVSFSWSSLKPLLDVPPGTRRTDPLAFVAMFKLATVKDGLTIWLRFSKALAVPPATWAAWLLLLVEVGVTRRWKWLPTILAAFVVFPILFVYTQYRSSYPWGDRYFSPFFGFGLVTLVAAIDIVLDLWQRWSPRLTDRQRAVAVATGAVVLAATSGVPGAIYRMGSDVGQLRGIPANFSPYYRAYREIWEERKPVMVLHQWLYTTDFQRFYFRYVLPPNGITYRQFDLLGYDIDHRVLKTGIPWFLTAFVNEGAFIVLDEKEKDCAARTVPPIPPPTRVERVHSVTACMWKVRGATTLAELAQAADLVGFGGAARLR